jgi:ribonuclease R
MNNTLKENDLIVGKVKSTGKKYGFIVTDSNMEVFIPPLEFQKVYAGDRVKAEVVYRNNKPQVKINSVIENKYSSYIGVFKMTEKGAFVVPENKDKVLIHQWLRIPKAKRLKAVDGDFVRVNIIEYPIENKKPKGEIVKVIGQKDSPNYEANYYFEKSKVPVYFDNSVTDKSFEFDQSFIKAKKKERKDLTMLPFITIDGENTRDIDDAIFCKKTDDGWKLWVAISDVSAFIKEDSVIDKEAFKRTTSVYSPLKYAAMLPENLSSNLCSLMADVERLAMVCYMQLGHDGKIQNYSFYESVIRTKARMTYNEVEKYIQNTLDIEYDGSVLNNLSNICDLHKVLRKYRKDNLIVTPRPDNIRYILDENRQVQGVTISEYQESHEVVEEMMLLANMSAANFLNDNFENGLYRSNNGFKDNSIDGLTKYLCNVGIKVDGNLDDLESFRKIFPNLVKHKSLMQAMNSFVNKSEYSNTKGIHLGLGINKYTYFTSPIRRYADIIVHRLIKSIIYKEECKPVTTAMIGHLNAVESNLANVTNNIARLMNCKLVKNMDIKTAYGTVIGITRHGCTVNLDDYNVDGFIHVQTIKEKTEYDDNIKKITSENVSIQLGDRVFVEISQIDIENRNVFLNLKDNQ